MSLWQLRYHNEKLQFLLDFLNEKIPEFPLGTPLMIYGSGGNGKSTILHEVLEQSPVPIVVFSGEGPPAFQFYPTQKPSSKLAVLIVCLGTPEDMDFAEYLEANIVEFLRDPAFNLGGAS